MRLKISLQQALFAASIGGIALSSAVIVFLVFEVPVYGFSVKLSGPIKNPVSSPAAAGASVDASAAFGLPARIVIPSINVVADFEFVGLTDDGAMDVPKNPAAVAWFKSGPRPGEVGSAVVAGHYGQWKNGEGSVFDNLHTLRPGDKIYITDDKGAIVIFTVREARRYDPDADAADVFGSSDGKVHLNLVTCEGVWDEATQKYSKRLVVFTDKE